MQNIPRTSGIYKWTCTPTGKIYIGSAKDIQKRYREHLYTLRGGKHVNIYLQRSWNKYGESAFTFDVIELVLSSFRLEREQYWLDTLRPFDRKKGFNISPTAGTSLGSKYPEGRGRKWTPEQREEQRQRKLGKPFTEEHKQRMSEAMLARSKPKPPRVDRRVAKYWVLTDPNGVEHHIRGLCTFCQEHDLSHKHMRRIAQGKRNSHQGWKCRYAGQSASGGAEHNPASLGHNLPE